MENKNFMEVTFNAESKNEGFARTCVAAFCLQLNPTLDEISDIKTVVSEAVTNCVVHAYPHQKGLICLRCEIEGRRIKIEVSDKGVGIRNIEEARQPFYTTKPKEERSGMGFTVMEGFMDKVEVKKNEDKGITVTLYKEISSSIEQAAGE